eukprot:g2097.t1
MQHSGIQKLESLRVLSAMRSKALESRPVGEELEKSVDKLEEYLYHLNDLTKKSEDYWTKKTEKQLQFHWSSPLSSRVDLVRLCGIELEVIMVTFLYGCVLRELVHWQAQCAINDEVDSSWISEPVRKLRTAAGIFQYICGTYGKRIESEIGQNPNLPSELVPATSECMGKICLAEAQALVAYRAHEKGNSVSVRTALHTGSSDLFEEASSALRKNTGNFNYLSERFRRFIALSSSLEQTRAYQEMAEYHRQQEEAGKAVGLCQRALSILGTCFIVAEEDSAWKFTVQKEQDFSRKLKDCFDQDRVNVYYQQVPTELQSLPDGKILVEAIEYKPTEKQPFL